MFCEIDGLEVSGHLVSKASLYTRPITGNLINTLKNAFVNYEIVQSSHVQSFTVPRTNSNIQFFYILNKLSVNNACMFSHYKKKEITLRVYVSKSYDTLVLRQILAYQKQPVRDTPNDNQPKNF